MRRPALFFAFLSFGLSPLPAQQVLDIGLGNSPIAVDRTPAPVIYAGRFRSLDGGATWSPYYLITPGRAQPPLYALLVDPDQPGNCVLRHRRGAGGIWKSSDRGATWTAANSGLPATGVRFEELFASLVPPYALYTRAGGAVYRSVDQARTWVRQSTLPGPTGIFRILCATRQSSSSSERHGLDPPGRRRYLAGGRLDFSGAG